MLERGLGGRGGYVGVFFMETVWVKEECLIAFVACAGMGAVGGLLEFSAV